VIAALLVAAAIGHPGVSRTYWCVPAWELRAGRPMTYLCWRRRAPARPFGGGFN
jgi:hypothetical protein